MQATSAAYDRLLAGNDYWYETRLVIDGVGTFGESDLFSINTNIEMFQQDPEIGRAISGEVNVSMINPTVPIPTMAKIRPQVRACGTAPKSSKVTITGEDLASEYATYSSENITFSAESGATVVGETLSFAVDSSEYLESEWLAQGVYFIDTREVTQNNNGLDVLSLHGFDAMLKTEQIYSSNATVGDDLDIAYVRAIASAIGVTVDPRTWEIMQTGYMIPFPLGYSMREILGYIASAYAGCFIISDTGQLRLVALEDIESETRYLIDEIGNIIVFGVDSPQHTVTASGAIASFTAGGEYDLDELEIAIDPVQDLHGQDAPYPAGGGKNKCPRVFTTKTSSQVTFTASEDSFKVNGTANALADYTSDTFSIPSGTYILNGNTGGSSSTYRLNLYKNGSGGGLKAQSIDGDSSAFTVSDTDVLQFHFYVNSGTQMNNVMVYPMIRLSSVSDATFAPYSNLCPISGWTGMDIYQSDNAPQTFIDGKYYNDNGNLTNSANTRYEEAYIPVSVDKRYTFKFGATSTNRLRVHEYDSNQTRLRQIISTPVSTTEISYKPSSDASYIRFSYPIACNTVNLYLKEIPISWQSEGTVFKGTLNVKTGVLTATHQVYTATSATTTLEERPISTDEWLALRDTTAFTNAGTASASNTYCSHFPYKFANVDGTTHWYVSGTTTAFFVIPRSGYPTRSDFLNSLTGNNVLRCVAPLATPLTYQLSPQQVKTLLGQNNLWANTGNVINLEFTEPATEAVRILV